jgi:tripartite-type tricarboxylate transporter receptor subunit TctC
VIDNRAGASGNIGAQAASRAAPDGHTLVLSVNTFLMNAALYKSLPYDPVKSFDPIVELATGSLVLAVHPRRRPRPPASSSTTRRRIRAS